MFLLARDLLGAPAWVALFAMGFAGFDRMVLHTGLNPYFNQLWGQMTLPFTLVLAWWVVRPGEADRRDAGILLAIFLLVTAFAYPFVLPIAAMPLVVFLWRERRRRIAEGRPVPRIRSLYRGRAAAVEHPADPRPAHPGRRGDREAQPRRRRWCSTRTAR